MSGNSVSNSSLLSMPVQARSSNDPQLRQIVQNVRHELNRHGIERYGPRTWSHPRRKHIPEHMRDFSQWADTLHAEYLKYRLPRLRDLSKNALVEYEKIRVHNTEKWGHPDAINLMRGLADGLEVNLRVIVRQEGEWREFYPRPFDRSRETIEISYVPIDRAPQSPACESAPCEPSTCSQGDVKSVSGKLKRLGLRECLIEYSNESVFEAFSCALRGAGIYRFATSAPFLLRGSTIPADSEGFRELIYDFAVDQRVANSFGPHFAPCPIDRWQTRHDKRLLKVMAKGFGVNVVVVSESLDVNKDHVTTFYPYQDTVYLVERFDPDGSPHYNAAKPVDGLVDRRCEEEGCIYTETE